MDYGSMKLAFSNIAIGVLVIALCIPLRMNKIRMNCWYGIRFRKSFESDDNWYRINRYGANKLILWSMVIIVIGVLTFFVPNDFKAVLRFAPVILIIPTMETLVFARKL